MRGHSGHAVTPVHPPPTHQRSRKIGRFDGLQLTPDIDEMDNLSLEEVIKTRCNKTLVRDT